MIGTVKYYNSDRGYGFIRRDETDIFFHVSNVKDRQVLTEGQNVDFDTEYTAKGIKAIKIIPVK